MTASPLPAAAEMVTAATVELNAGADLAVVSEEYNLSEGKSYPMTGVNGMKPDVRYGYVLPEGPYGHHPSARRFMAA